MQKIYIPFVAKCFFAHQYFNIIKQNVLLVFPDEESTLTSYKHLRFLAAENDIPNILYFPSFDTLPYNRLSPSPKIIEARASILSTLSLNRTPKIIATNASNLIVKLPSPSIFKNSVLNISIGDKLLLNDLVFFLDNNGFTKSRIAVNTREFAIKGKIIDIVHSDGVGYSVSLYNEVIDSIKEFDVNSQVSTMSISTLELFLGSELVVNPNNIEVFQRNFLKNFGITHVNHQVYKSIISKKKSEGYEYLLPLFYEEMSNLTDYLFDHVIIYDDFSLQPMIQIEKSYKDFYQSRMINNTLDPDFSHFDIRPDKIITSSNDIQRILSSGHNLFITDKLQNKGNIKEDNIHFLRILGDKKQKLYDEIECLRLIDPSQSKDINLDHHHNIGSGFFGLDTTLINNNKSKIIVVCCSSNDSEKQIKNHIEKQDYTINKILCLKKAKKSFVNIAITSLEGSFFTKDYLFISEKDILSDNFTYYKDESINKRLKNTLDELDNIIEEDLVVHKDHGIGRFQKIETIVVNKTPHDFLKILYFNNDILYLPVENIDLIKKYGNKDGDLDKLGSLNWEKRKARLKKQIKDIASNLIKISAERELHTTEAVQFNDHLYLKFCNRFIYNETKDQLSVIKEIEEDLKSNKLMDRLICGDVGFGKTEVAMRAAFMVAFDCKSTSSQVVIISPTTILCRQHYVRFQERFNGFNITINQLSRLVSTTEAKTIKKNITNGEIRIIIGTHALLSKDIKFKNLKLLIIDEEQHFGVTQKEFLKSLKFGVHVLSLSATPIPRTLQMSMSGLKDLSLITTPPLDRLPIITTIIPFNAVIIRDMLMREHLRGGKSFYVVPRIKDIEWVEKKLLKYVPDLKFKIVHGQMLPSDLDRIMNEFYDGKFDILVSTTIIESGIDIASANTIIVHKADMLGLSQLYQLRGRVGRSKVTGYACLTLINEEVATKHSWKRLEILKNINSLGAGLTIANHDMDLRGFGNLVGGEQSGHIKEIGFELYKEMLNEAISDSRKQNLNECYLNFNTSINLDLAVYIPASYIKDSSLRFAIYRRTANLKNYYEIEMFKNEMIDRFGNIPQVFKNLLKIIELKTICHSLRIESLDSGPGGFVIKFNKNFDVLNTVISFVKKFPKNAQIKPDYKIVILRNLKNSIDIFKELEAILEEIRRCMFN